MGIQERRERERETRRNQIMSAAKRIFSSKGFNRSTMEDIASDAELSPGTLYLYFKNKEELYASLTVEALQTLTKRLEEVNEKKDLNPEEKLMALTESLYESYEADPLTFINMFHLQSSITLKNLSPELMSTIKKLSGSTLGACARVFEEGVNEGLFIDNHPVALADIFWGLFSGIVLWEESKRIIDYDKDYLKKTLEIAFRIFARGIKKGQNS